jgi:hypothetical protein|uniref:Uncharacterized protein n=1 Tax=Mus musculus TaxID=10090 RepID=Q3TSU2_MOUSE|nr:unnamed protein product [Mus musculus]
MLSCKEPVIFLRALKKKTHIHERTIPAFCFKKKKKKKKGRSSWVTLLLSSLDQFNFRSIRLKFYALSVFLFLAKQHDLGFSDMEHFFLPLLWNSVLLYLLCNSFPNDPQWLRSALQHSAHPHRLAVWLRCTGFGCASFLSLVASPNLPAVPLVCKLPAFTLVSQHVQM